MLNTILNGGLGESRSGATTGVTPTPETVSFWAGSERVTVPAEDYESIYKPLSNIYNEAYGYAYSKNLKQPKWSDVLAYGQVVADWYKEGKVFDADAYEVSIAAQQQASYVSPSVTEPTVTEPTVIEPTVTEPTVTEPPVVVIPETDIPQNANQNTPREDGTNQSRSGSTPRATVAPSENEGSSLLIPGLILASGVVATILLTSKSKKRR